MSDNPHPLAVARAARAMTGVDLAREVCAAAERRGFRSGVDKQRVRKWEAGVTPDQENQLYIAEALGLPPEIVDAKAWPNWLPAVGIVPLGPASTVPALREALRASMDRSRRTVLSVISGTALITLAGTWAATDAWLDAAEHAPGGKAVGEELVALLEEASDRLTTLAVEDRQHTAALIEAHLATVTDLIAGGRYSPQLGTRLHALAASLSQTVAWHRFDHGRHGEAARFWVAGLHSAHAGGDHDMGAALLSDLAYQASWRNDPRTAASILERALTRTHHPAARSLLTLRLARALAADNEERATIRALQAAEKLLGTSAAEPMPAWCSWLSEADLAVDSGQCLLDLGDVRRGHQLIREGQQLLPARRDKTRGVFLTYQAKSHLDLGEPERAASAAIESLDLAQRLGAPRCVELVRGLVPQFEKFRDAAGVGDLLARARA
ncbi:helix-turn-helix transcriptional regulator [Streptomyces sp. NPDC048623]|uniref:helix-turn-helix domain-containing protein n=1 Tax=Streptomyces sp. NPDC048623 TaxID=3155761 RepID=UPI0034467888